MNFLRIIFLLCLFSCKASTIKTEDKTDFIKDEKGRTIVKIETGSNSGPFKDTNATSLPFKIVTYYDSLGRPIKVKAIKLNFKSLETFYYKDTLSVLWTVYELGRSSDITDTTFINNPIDISLVKEQRLNKKNELIYEYTETRDSTKKCTESIYDSLTGNWTKTNNCH